VDKIETMSNQKISFATRFALGTAVLAVGVNATALAHSAHSTSTRIVHRVKASNAVHHPAPSSTPAYTNPVIDANFPDPSVVNDGGTYYAYATNSGENMPTERSSDLIHWTPEPDSMPTLPAWVRPGRTWAPNVTTIGPGKRYVAYFAAWDNATDKQAVGAAVASSPEGPFVGTDAPLVEQTSIGGAIDPSCFTAENGDHYLLWKNDGNSMGVDTWIWIQKLSTDGVGLVGDPIKLIKQDQWWEGNLVEAPTLWRHGSKYFLFYSANDYASCNYAIGYAVANSLLGPYFKPATGPWMASTNDACGPGGEDVVRASNGTIWMAYHTWAKGPHTYRSMSIKRLEWHGDIPVLK
jgi:beta-xylosidase